MAHRRRHWMIELQRANRARPLTYAVNDDGDEIRGDSIRQKIRDGEGPAKRANKREATRTRKQRSDNMRAAQRALAEMRRDIEDTSKIFVTDKSGLIVTPQKPRKPKQKKQQKSGWKKRASGLFVRGGAK